MNWTAILVAGLTGSGLGSALVALVGRPKMRADSAKVMIETATDLLEPLREEVARLGQEAHRLGSELAAARQTIATQQGTIAEQQRTIALQNTSLAETRSELVVLNRAFLALQDWVRANGGDPRQILAELGHPPGPAGIPIM